MEQTNRSDKYQQRNCKNTVNLRNWTGAWLISMAITAFAPKYLWDYNTLLTLLSVVVHLSLGYGMLMANKRHLDGLDEMQRKILFDAMALSLGVGLVVGLSYELFENIKLITFEPEIAHLVIIMCLTYLVGVISGHRKYQ